jgi:hypothetical protein
LLARRKINPAALVDCIDELTDIINAHFAHEEMEGYFDQIVQMAPHLQTKVGVLKDQHRAFRRSLGEFRWLARANCHSPNYWEELETRFHGFMECFGEHERTENALLQEAYERDMGDSD